MSAVPEVKHKLRKVYKRCRICHSKEQLEFHHIIPDGNDNPNNLIILCHHCHEEENRINNLRIKGAAEKLYEHWKQNYIESKKNQKTSYETYRPPTYEIEQIVKREIKKEMQLMHSKFSCLKKELKQEVCLSDRQNNIGEQR